jgi:hypothetical protein
LYRRGRKRSKGKRPKPRFIRIEVKDRHPDSGLLVLPDFAERSNRLHAPSFGAWLLESETRGSGKGREGRKEGKNAPSPISASSIPTTSASSDARSLQPGM